MPSESASICSSSSVVNAGPVERGEVLVELGGRGRPDERRGDDRVAQHPLDRELRERLPALLGDDVESAKGRERPCRSGVVCGSDERCCARSALPSPRYLSVSSPWASGVNAIAPSPSCFEDAGEAVLDPAVEDRVRGLVDDERRAEAAGDGRRRPRCAPRCTTRCRRRAPCPAARACRARRSSPRSGRRRVDAVGVEDVDVVDAHARERLLGAREDVLARAARSPYGPGPHVVAGLRRDDELVAVGREVLAHHPAEVRLGRAVRRAVVVGQIEVRDAAVERVAQQRRAAGRRGCCRRSSTTARARSGGR